jgi:hypothetical protein
MTLFNNILLKKILILIIVYSISINLIFCSSSNSVKDNVLSELGVKNDDVDTNLTEEEIDADTLKAPDFASKELSLTNTKKEENILKGFHQIQKIAGREEIDYDRISDTYYQTGLRDITLKLDSYNRTSYDPEIRNYIELGKTNIENADLKLINTLAKVFKEGLYYQLSLAVDEDIFFDKTSLGSPNHWDKAYVYFQALDKWIRDAAFYLNDNDLSMETIEKHFEAGSVLVYQNTKDAHISLYIEAQRIEKKIMKTFFVNMIENLNLIIKEKTQPKPDYDRMLSLIIKARKSFETFSRIIGNEEVKRMILKEMGKTFTIDPENIINNCIFFIFYQEIENILINMINVLSSNDDKDRPLMMAWEAYFYYIIFRFDYKNRLGEEKAEQIEKIWSSLILSTEKGNLYLSQNAIDLIGDYLEEYLKLLEISYIG